MPTPAYTDYPTSAFAVKKPISWELMLALYNNPAAIAGGADGAPRVSRRAIAPGGSEIEGAFVNATVAPSAPGFYEYTSLALSTAKVFPFVSVLRIAGNVTLSALLSVAPADTEAKQSLGSMLRCIAGATGAPSTGATAGGGGGAALGDGGSGSAGVVGTAGKGLAAISRRWLEYRMLGGLGGASGSDVAGGGGVFVVIIQGNLDATGGTISADGQIGYGNVSGSPGSSGTASGGGGGGTLIVIVTGTVTGGTFTARGGDGGSDSSGANSCGGGGGGGYVALVASNYVGAQTLSAAGGAAGSVGGVGGQSAGTAGITEKITLTEAQINGLLLR